MIMVLEKKDKIIKSIQSRIKKANYILRVTDKSGIFHMSHLTDYEEKAEAYSQKTSTYIESESDPLRKNTYLHDNLIK
jgi:hypothetical protein